MTPDTGNACAYRHGILKNATAAGALLALSAASISWAWNAMLPQLPDPSRLSFAAALPLAATVLFAGALFETGRRLANRAMCAKQATLPRG